MVLAGHEVGRYLFEGPLWALCRASSPRRASVLLKHAVSSSPEPFLVERLHREFELASTLRIPGVLRALDLVESGGKPVLVFEDPGGVLLSAPLDRTPPLDTALRIVSGLAATLAALHQSGLIHRDVQPCNVLLDEAGAPRLLGLGAATRVPRAVHSLREIARNPAAARYLSPEITGRMGRLVDYRTDLYSLGVLFFELLTGRAPFEADDPLELIHAHVAKRPPSPRELAPALPEPVSEIALKLLAKTAEDRYQGGLGLCRDLDRCRRELAEKGTVVRFRLAAHDQPSRFELPQRFYGRGKELSELHGALDDAARGQLRVVLLAGPPGVGKTALARELRRTVFERRGLFGSGKFDALKRRTPYSGIVEALRDVWRELLADDPEGVSAYRERLSAALGPNLGVIAAATPEIEDIVGKAPPVAALGPLESNNRFHLCFRQTLEALGLQDRPLVLFLDDLQWADPSSMELLLSLSANGPRHLLLLGAYRDGEGQERNALALAVDAMGGRGIPFEVMELRPLELQDVRRLVADALSSDVERCGPLADLVFRKTAGNAFFARAFLTNLHEEGFLQPDAAAGWTWDPSRIARQDATENVTDLAAQKIARLPEALRRTISMAAALGHPLDLSDLAAVCETSPDKVEADLVEACRRRIFVKAELGYRFEHDRLQECAYELIHRGDRADTHLRIGRLLAESQRENVSVFQILDHWNRALDRIEDPAEREAMARRNLEAGRLARAGAAFPAAYQYFSSGLSLLDASAWQGCYELCLALHTEAAQAAFLTANFRESDRLTDLVLARARSLLDKIPVYETRIALANAGRRETEAFQEALEVARLLGVEVPPKPSPEDINAAVLEAKDSIRTLLAHPWDRIPPMTDGTGLAAMHLLTSVTATAGMLDYSLYWMVVCKLLELTVRLGVSPEAPVVLIMAGGMLCHLLDDYEGGYQSGARGMALVESSALHEWKPFCCFLFAVDVSSWRTPCAALVEELARARRTGLDGGDVLVASAGAYYCCEASLHAGKDLTQLEKLIRRYREENDRVGVERISSGLLQLERTVAALKDGPSSQVPPAEEPPAADEPTQPWHVDAKEIAACHALLVRCLYRDRAAAVDSALRAAELPKGYLSSFVPTDFLICLGLLEGLPSVVGRERERYLSIIAARQERLRIRAQVGPADLRHKLDLVEAQRLSAVGETTRAMSLYDEAIDGASRSGCVHEEGLANELTAEFYLELGRRRIGGLYLQAAASAYRRWGAWGKLATLYEKYPDLLSQGAEPALFTGADAGAPDGPLDTGSDALDFSSIERAGAALAAEIELPRLLRKLMEILLQAAGAQRGFLVQEDEGRILIEASGSVEEEGYHVFPRTPLEATDQLSRRIVLHVSRSHETVIVGNAPRDARFGDTPYVLHARPKSILCTPILHRGRPIAILYLENNEIGDAFSRERVAAIQVISSQAAVALENARLHDGLRTEIEARKSVEEDLRQALEQVAQLRDKLQAENAYLREEIQDFQGFEAIVGRSEPLRKVLHRVAQVAPTEATVLILGETGTGKELVARAIHGRSSRNGSPLVRVNCATLPATLIESELFGHEKGAFTGALSRKQGRFELADGGTIFLDEIGELALELQAKLLRVLQEGEFEKVGSSVTQKVDVRVIAATNRDLKRETEEGTFRSDLYYRLSVFPIEVPPLRARAEDIPVLVWHFITRKQGGFGKTITAVSAQAMDALTAYGWPGNIRELENVIERALILSPGPHLVLEESLIAAQHKPPSSPAGADLEEVERAHILAVLDLCGWKVKGPGNAADKLGLNASTLRFRMKKLGIERPQGAPPRR